MENHFSHYERKQALSDGDNGAPVIGQSRGYIPSPVAARYPPDVTARVLVTTRRRRGPPPPSHSELAVLLPEWWCGGLPQTRGWQSASPRPTPRQPPAA